MSEGRAGEETSEGAAGGPLEWRKGRMTCEAPWGCWECVAGVHEATIDSACHLWTKVLTVWKMVPKARGRRAGSRGRLSLGS